MEGPRAASTIAQELSGTARLLINDPAELTQPRANLRTAASRRFDPFAMPSGNNHYLREKRTAGVDVWTKPLAR